ncbi:MAG: hypothetical protein ACLFN8_03125 [Candidatus Woesearchaeota archaeon]
MKILKTKKGAIEDFGELFIAGIIIFVIITIFFFYLSRLDKRINEAPDIYVNDLEAMHTTRIIMEWQYTHDQQIYEQIINLYNQNKKTEIIDIIKKTITKEFQEPGDWLIAIDNYPDDVYGSIGLSNSDLNKMEGSRKYLPKMPLPNPESDKPIKILVKRVTAGDYQNVNRGKSQSEIIEIAVSDYKYNDHAIN